MSVLGQPQQPRPDSGLAERGDVPGTPRLVRRSGGRVIGGVAGGLADHLGTDVFKIRVAFVVLSTFAGAGLVAYGLLWAFTPGGHDTVAVSPSERRHAYGLAILGVGLTAGVSLLFSGAAAHVLVPVIAVAIGAALVWREYDAADGDTSGLVAIGRRPTTLTWVRIVGGVTLVVVGLAVIGLARIDFASLGPALIAVVVTLVGVGLLTIPLWLRLRRALLTERAARIRTAEREEIASHLHDSVLQTLALIQRQSEDSPEVLRLARSQERELRAWLFREPGEAGHVGLAAALRAVAGEVEDQHGVKVAPVTVGDIGVEEVPERLSREQFTAVLGATREALVNAAKHAGVGEVDLFAEAEPHQVSVFVRDRGVGFDPSGVSADRHGLAKSIRGRVERRGGQVAIRSSAGTGTEVRITMPCNGHRGKGDDLA